MLVTLKIKISLPIACPPLVTDVWRLRNCLGLNVRQTCMTFICTVYPPPLGECAKCISTISGGMSHGRTEGQGGQTRVVPKQAHNTGPPTLQLLHGVPEGTFLASFLLN